MTSRPRRPPDEPWKVRVEHSSEKRGAWVIVKSVHHEEFHARRPTCGERLHKQPVSGVIRGGNIIPFSYSKLGPKSSRSFERTDAWVRWI